MTWRGATRMLATATALALVSAFVLGVGGAAAHIPTGSEAGGTGAGASHSGVLSALAVVVLALLVVGMAALGAVAPGRRRSGPER